MVPPQRLDHLERRGRAWNTTREGYVAAVEPICKANTEASGKILKGVKGEVRAGKLKPAAAKFARAATALKKTWRQLSAVPKPTADTAKLSKWLGYVKTDMRKTARTPRITAVAQAAE